MRDKDESTQSFRFKFCIILLFTFAPSEQKEKTMSNNWEESFKVFIRDEVQKLEKKNHHIPVAQFCKENNISRVTLWRAEKNGTLKLQRIGKKVFVPSDWSN